MLNTISLSCCHLPTKSSLPSSLHICITSSLSSFHVALTLHPLFTPARPPTSSCILSLKSISCLSVNLIPVSLSLTHLVLYVTAASSVDSPLSSIIIHNSPSRSLQAYKSLSVSQILPNVDSFALRTATACMDRNFLAIFFGFSSFSQFFRRAFVR